LEAQESAMALAGSFGPDFLQESAMGRWVDQASGQSGWMGKIPSSKLSHNYGKSPFLMGKSTISMAISNSYVKLPEGRIWGFP